MAVQCVADDQAATTSGREVRAKIIDAPEQEDKRVKRHNTKGYLSLVGNTDELSKDVRKEILTRLSQADIACDLSPADENELLGKLKTAALSTLEFLRTHGGHGKLLAKVKHLKHLRYIRHVPALAAMAELGSLAMRITPALLGLATLFDLGHLIHCLVKEDATLMETGIAAGRLVIDGALLASAVALWTISPWLFLIPSATLTALDLGSNLTRRLRKRMQGVRFRDS